ncbi:glycerate kinase [Bifidobacterium sp. DSM 109960]|uniref:Glycerate kinase n=1 Tax=Bifidobacterium erythrocebi TaxID=2675325 RepID=A0A7Y0EUB8_9BIFI|nr:glycerate kinase [Bifidobacterium sp. DSM 109960]NMM96580.1 glycerate kinase [Bifidobacterium sp. DSM 109960]
MRYLLAPDSFKEAASAQAVAEAMRRGIRAADPDAEYRVMPLSDGGEGLTAALVGATGGKLRSAHVHDALGRPIVAQYGFLEVVPESDDSVHSDGETHVRTAVVELAAASGLERIRPADRDPLAASTFGTGELIRAAIDEGADRIVLGLGGSATTDGGTGLARALGYRFLDCDDCELPFGGSALPRLARIDDTDVPSAIRSMPIVLACDVTNPLTGPRGAAAVFAPQKGADARQVALLDAGLGKLADAIETLNGRAIGNLPGSGAAGGTGGGMLGLFNATMRPGIELVLDLLHAREACAWADVVITGEGSIDSQTPYGKVPSGIARLAKSQGKPAIAIGGKVTRDPQTLAALREAGIVATFGTAPGPADLPELLADTERNVESTCAAIAGLLRASTQQTPTSAVGPVQS